MVADAATPDAATPRPEEPEDQILPHPAGLPLQPNDVLRISNGTDIDIVSAFLVRPDGHTVLAFDRSNVAFSHATLFTSHSRDGNAFSVPRELTHPNATLVANPSAVRQGESLYLYYTTASSIQDGDGAASFRRLLSPSGLGEPEAVGKIPQGNWLLCWPFFHARTDGKTMVAYRTTSGAARLATSTNGVSIGSSVAIPTADSSAMPSAAELGNGQYAYSFQVQGTAGMVSYVTTSPDGVTWSAPSVVSAASNVHDTSFARRADGGLDLYYIYSGTSAGFRLYRRALGTDGKLGTEQRLTADALGEPSKPRATRLPDGRVLLAYAEITTRAADLSPSNQRVVLAELPGDAP